MRFAQEVLVELALAVPGLREVPFQPLLQGLLQVGFEPGKSRELLEHARARMQTPLLRPQAVEDGGLLVEHAALFPQTGDWHLLIERGETRLRTPLETEALPHVAEFLRRVACADTLKQVREDWLFDDEHWDETLFALGPPPSPWPEPTAPGIYRREHASLLIRSRTTSVLVDPIGLQRRLRHIHAASGTLPAGGVDAIAVTHGHGDHWHLPSLLTHLPRRDIPVLVPHVPRVNMLNTVDFAQALRSCGQRVEVPAWGERVTVGDIQVDILPFHGEQPVRDGPALEAGLRNWGNCYRFTTEDFSCLVLVDSGVDPEGSMAEVVARSRERWGPVDVVLACQREFLAPFFGGLSVYWATVPWERLRAMHGDYQAGRLSSVTAGPSGIAEVCVAAGARYFLPYANGFEGVGQPITDVGWGDGEPSEARCNVLVREQLARRGGTTEVLEWNPGGVARFERGQLTLRGGAD